MSKRKNKKNQNVDSVEEEKEIEINISDKENPFFGLKLNLSKIYSESMDNEYIHFTMNRK